MQWFLIKRKVKEMNTKFRNPEMSDKGKNWNVVSGCSKYSDGCANCYAEDTATWLAGMGQKLYKERKFEVTCRENRLNWPMDKLAKNPKRPVRTFVTDMGDLFHEKVPDSFIRKVFATMQKVPQHRFYVLTKRAERLAELGPELPWQPWIWAGVTIESEKYLHRYEKLMKLPVDVNKFLMLEPLLSPIPNLPLEGIQWVVVGGETNSRMRFRPMEEKWVIDIRDQVEAKGIPFMFKHWPGKSHNSSDALLEGKRWEEYPKSILTN